MLLNEVITLMQFLLNKDLQEVINLLKNKNINYAYNNILQNVRQFEGSWNPDWNRDFIYKIRSKKRFNNYNNSYIYLVVLENIVFECKLYQVNKEQVYVATALGECDRVNMSLNDVGDIIVV